MTASRYAPSRTPKFPLSTDESKDFVEHVLDMTPQAVCHTADFFLGPKLYLLGEDFWEGLSLAHGVVALRASLLLWICTQGDKVPKRFQLEATLAIEDGKDSDVDVGTGYGKTFCMIISQLLHPLDVAFIISPLKLLHAAQTADFLQYGISTICINEDTPEDDELWHVGAFPQAGCKHRANLHI